MKTSYMTRKREQSVLQMFQSTQLNSISATEFSRDSNRITKILIELEPLIYEYCSIIGITRKVEQQCAFNHDDSSENADRVSELITKSVRALRILGSPENICSFIRAQEGISIEARDMLYYWRNSPWQFSFFMVEERLDKNLFRIRRAGSSKSEILYSSSINQLEETVSPSLYHGLLVSNRAILSIYGLIGYGKNFLESDAEFLARMSDSKGVEEKGLSKVLNEQSPFLYLLYKWINFIPAKKHGETIGLYIGLTSLKQTLKIRSHREVVVNKLKSAGWEFLKSSKGYSVMVNSEVYGCAHLTLDYKHDTLILQTMTEAAYSKASNRLFSVIGKEIPLRDKISLGAVRFAREHNLQPDVKRYGRALPLYEKYRKSVKKNSSFKESLVKAIKTVMAAQKRGESLTPNDFCKQTGVQKELLPIIEQAIAIERLELCKERFRGRSHRKAHTQSKSVKPPKSVLDKDDVSFIDEQASKK